MAQVPLSLVQAEPGQSRYGALASALRQRILAGEWPPGHALPAETTLASEHGVALGTLRRALDVLDDQGLIERRHGRGTFVRSGLAGAPMLRFFRFGERSGEVPALAHRVAPGRRRVARNRRAGWGSAAAKRSCACSACARWAANPASWKKSGCRCRSSPP